MEETYDGDDLPYGDMWFNEDDESLDEAEYPDVSKTWQTHAR